MNTNELNFTVLGPSRCGKTTLLACMNEYFGRVMPSSFQSGDPEMFGKLNEAYNKLKDDAEGENDIIFSGGIEGTDDEKQYPFTLKGSRKNIQLRFFDFPGDWLNLNAPQFKKVSETAKNSSVIIAVINSPYLMQYDGKYKDWAGISNIEYVIRNSMTHDGGGKLILLVPVKCEKYLTNGKYGELLRDTVKKDFADTISLADSRSPYYGKIAIAVLPVKTMGNVQLRRVEIRDGTPIQIFGKVSNVFRPEDTDQPLRYAMSFMIEQYKKRRSRIMSFFDNVFGNGNLDSITSEIRSGIKQNIRGAEIIAGRELLGLPAENENVR